MVQIRPRVRRGLPSTMSWAPMFSRWTLCSLRNVKDLSTFSRQWIRIFPFVGFGWTSQISKIYYYITMTTEVAMVPVAKRLHNQLTMCCPLWITLSISTAGNIPSMSPSSGPSSKGIRAPISCIVHWARPTEVHTQTACSSTICVGRVHGRDQQLLKQTKLN